MVLLIDGSVVVNVTYLCEQVRHFFLESTQGVLKSTTGVVLEES